MVKVARRILVVDDEPTVCESCRRIFADRGYHVETAESADAGLDQAMHGYYDCALIDLRMPEMDGMEIVRTARASRRNMPILIITGYGSVETAAEATRLGVSDYVCKPFAPDEIVAAVERAIRRTGSLPGPDVLDGVRREIRHAAPRPEYFEHHAPRAVAEVVTSAAGVKKATASVLSVAILGILAGAYIAFGAALATLVGHDAAAKLGVGAAKLLTGSVFSVGLILVVIAGAELFTGNNLMIASVLGRKVGLGRLLSRWAVVYAANFVGSLLLVLIMYESGLWRTASNAVGAKAVAIANAKVNLSFGEAFFRGIGCNWLVCLAVWMAFSAKRIAGKVLVIFFPIMAFVALGYEHCVANMYFIPMGLLLKGAAAGWFPAGTLASLTWGRFLAANLLPVTLGNIVGGAVFVGCAYWWVYLRPAKEAAGSAEPLKEAEAP